MMRLEAGLLLVLSAYLSPSLGDITGCDPFLEAPRSIGSHGQRKVSSPCAMFTLQPEAQCPRASLSAGRAVVVVQSSLRRNSVFTSVEVMSDCHLTFFRPRMETQHLSAGVHILGETPPTAPADYTITAFYCSCVPSERRVRRRARDKRLPRLHPQHTEPKEKADTMRQGYRLGADTMRQGPWLGADTMRQGHRLGADTMRQGHRLGADTMRQGHRLGADTMRQGHRLGADTMRQRHLLGAGTMRQRHLLGAGTIRQRHRLGAGNMRQRHRLGAGNMKQGHRLGWIS